MRQILVISFNADRIIFSKPLSYEVCDSPAQTKTPFRVNLGSFEDSVAHFL